MDKHTHARSEGASGSGTGAGGMTPDQARAFYKGEPMRTVVIRQCPDERCGETHVQPVPHPDDPARTPNRCPTCLATVSDGNPSSPPPLGPQSERRKPQASNPEGEGGA